MTSRLQPHPRPPALPASLSAPIRTLPQGRFELRQELGSGTTGTVWRAWDRHRGVEVALKILHRLDGEVRRRFKHEFRTLADLRHPNIVRFHELFEDDEQLFFSMELLDGVDVLSWIWGYHEARDRDPAGDADLGEDFSDEITQPNLLVLAGPDVDYARLRDVFRQLLDGLERLHATGYLHRDLKPSNLMVRRDGRLIILDFGLAVSLRSPYGDDLESAVGTIAYMAPEVAEQRSADTSADYYSVGVLLFEALTGRTPFAGDHLAEVLAAKLTSEAPSPAAWVPGVPADLAQLCQALLSRVPETRAGLADLVAVFRATPDAATATAAHRAAPAGEPRLHRWFGDTVPFTTVPQVASGSGLFARPPVVGRSRELSVLVEDLRQVAVVGMQCRLVIGPSGIGKTALVDAFARRLKAMRPAVTLLLGRCHDREAIPFRAIDELVDALARHLGALPDAALAALLPPHAELLAELFPVLRCLIPPGAGPPKGGGDRAAAFAAMRQLFAALARTGPLALVIDDLHLADPDSLDLIDQVFRGSDAPPLLLVGLGRPGPLMNLICSRATPEGSCLHRLELGPLQGAEAEHVVRALASYLDVPIADPVSLAIDTRGHPGFALEILRTYAPAPRATSLDFDEPIVARGPRRDGDDATTGLGRATTGELPALESVLAMRVLELPEATRRVLELLAVAGGLCSVELAANVLEYREGEVAAALDDLVYADLVVATGRGTDDAFEFYHERIREVVEATLSENVISAILHALAEGLERRVQAEAARRDGRG